MFGLDMLGTYDTRKVARTEYDVPGGQVIISTAKVTDGKLSYETAVSHPLYNSGKWIILQAYSQKAQAEAGHQKWVAELESDPPILVEVSNCFLSELAETEGRVHPRAEAPSGGE
jgi:hypothetical protein